MPKRHENNFRRIAAMMTIAGTLAAAAHAVRLDGVLSDPDFPAPGP